jgi:hypothetical protein
MGWTDAIDVANELLTRRWKRKLSVVILAGFVLLLTQAGDAVLWYGQERAKQITEQLLPIITRTTRPMPSPTTDRP